MKHIYSVLLPEGERKAIESQIDKIKHLKHPNIVQTIEFIDCPNTQSFHFVMENMEGGSLDNLIKQREELPMRIA